MVNPSQDTTLQIINFIYTCAWKPANPVTCMSAVYSVHTHIHYSGVSVDNVCVYCHEKTWSVTMVTDSHSVPYQQEVGTR